MSVANPLSIRNLPKRRRPPKSRPTMLVRGPNGKPVQVYVPDFGVGTELKLILADFGIPACLGCGGRAVEMNRAGVGGCRSRQNEMVGWLKDGAAKRGADVRKVAEAAGFELMLSKKGRTYPATFWAKLAATKLGIGDPFEILFDEAVRRAEMDIQRRLQNAADTLDWNEVVASSPHQPPQQQEGQ